jgi:pyrroloquinoline quinone biosynthesis protein B
MQDAGLPHVGCRCPRCVVAYRDPRRTEYAVALALVDNGRRPAGVWLVDATPDIRHQLNLLARWLGPDLEPGKRLRQPDGVLLTHAHMGHTAGLAQLGPEGMNVHDLPVYGPAGVLDVLQETRLWQPLRAGLSLVPLPPGRPYGLSDHLSVTPLAVPHRDELGAGTFAYHVQGPARSLLYVPDVDGWEQWPGARAALAAVDVALLDATFYSRDELGGRAPVAHPLVPETMSLAELPGRLVLTHLNHTNPLLDEHGEARRMVAAAGVDVARTGEVIFL